MKERIELDDSFEEEKESEKPKEKTEILNEPKKDDINILQIKTTETIKWKEDDMKNYNDRVKEMTKNILSRLIKISIILTFFTGIEFTGSYLSNSIGVLTISLHFLQC